MQKPLQILKHYTHGASSAVSNLLTRKSVTKFPINLTPEQNDLKLACCQFLKGIKGNEINY